MAYDFIGLVNDVNRRLNEVELTTANFAGAQGYYNLTKDAVNASMRHIHQEEFEWPWNHAEEEEILTPGEVRYSMPYNSKTVNMNSFRIKRDAAIGVGTTKLTVLNYEEYLDKHVDAEYNSGEETRGVPKYVIRAPSREILFVPAPKDAYEVVYEYYATGVDMALFSDVPEIPEQYRHTIVVVPCIMPTYSVVTCRQLIFLRLSLRRVSRICVLLILTAPSTSEIHEYITDGY